MQPIDFKKYSFHPVIVLPADYEVYDLTLGYHRPLRNTGSPFGIGRYNEKRPNMYSADLFAGVRDIHIGIDIGCPLGTPVYAFYPGEIFLFGNNSSVGDYGNTIVTKHDFGGVELYALFGHLSSRSLVGKEEGRCFAAGEFLAEVGDRHENGGWEPHLHFQLSYLKPEKPDMPGVVAEAEIDAALQNYPDPQLVLGKLYP